jgi:hypothetical protein
VLQADLIQTQFALRCLIHVATTLGPANAYDGFFWCVSRSQESAALSEWISAGANTVSVRFLGIPRFVLTETTIPRVPAGTLFFLRVAKAGSNLMRINSARIKAWFYE